MSWILFGVFTAFMALPSFAAEDHEDIAETDAQIENAKTEASTSALKDCPECQRVMYQKSLAERNDQETRKIVERLANKGSTSVPDLEDSKGTK